MCTVVCYKLFNNKSKNGCPATCVSRCHQNTLWHSGSELWQINEGQRCAIQLSDSPNRQHLHNIVPAFRTASSFLLPLYPDHCVSDWTDGVDSPAEGDQAQVSSRHALQRADRLSRRVPRARSDQVPHRKDRDRLLLNAHGGFPKVRFRGQSTHRLAVCCVVLFIHLFHQSRAAKTFIKTIANFVT